MPDISKIQAPPVACTASATSEVVLGSLVGFDDSGAPLVDWPGNPRGEPVPSLCTAAVVASDAGRMAALLFADGDLGRPLIIGLVREPMDAVILATERAAEEAGEFDVEQTESRSFEARVDGEKVVISAEQEIVLQCGKASITLTSAGKILLRGTYLLSRSSGVNRIKGGSVQIN